MTLRRNRTVSEYSFRTITKTSCAPHRAERTTHLQGCFGTSCLDQAAVRSGKSNCHCKAPPLAAPLSLRAPKPLTEKRLIWCM
jgi:hypothetical protein